MSGRETGIHAHGWVCAQLELQPDLSPDGRPGLSGSAGCQCSTGDQGERTPPRAGPQAAPPLKAKQYLQVRIAESRLHAAFAGWRRALPGNRAMVL